MASKSKKPRKDDAEGGDIFSQFIAVTGATQEVARNMLEACNMELDLAIGMYIDSGLGETSGAGPSGAGPSGSSGRSRPRPGSSRGGSGNSSASNSPKRGGNKRKAKSKSDEEDEDGIRAPIPQKREQLIDDTVLVNPRKIPSIASTKVRSVFDGFRDFRREAEEHQRAMLAGETLNGSSSSSSSSASFSSSKPSKKLKTLEELFRPPVDLLYPGTFLDAREEGKAGNLWLLINIQNHKEFACQCLNRDIWSHGTIKDIVKQHFVFWQVYHDSTEGAKFEQFYPIAKYPHVAILDPRTGESMKTFEKFDSLCFCESLSEFVRRNPSPDGSSNPALNHERISDGASTSKAGPGTKRKMGTEEALATLEAPSKSSRTPDLVDETEDSQLKLAIAASLAEAGAGGAKANGRRSRETAATESDDEDLETFSTSSDEEEEGKTESDVVTDEGLGDEASSSSASNAPTLKTPTTDTDDTGWRRFVDAASDGAEKTKLMFRLPDGERAQLEIAADAPLLALIHYCKSKGFSCERYELITNFPRKKLSYMDTEMSLKTAGLFPQETIFVQEREIPLAD